MVREFLEIDDLETFRRVAEQSPLVIRRDPFLFAQYFAVMFFVNLAEMERGEVKRLFEMLKGKTIVIKDIVEASTLSEFLRKKEA
ncbi:hypothetical protein DRO29_00920 [Candidatus Bathyarchaeota archaeon]|nr:MAG: hypothetical protein B6U84_03565 [Candidatus Bathyarchaeota archaeon ex4484_40]RJS67776.1 MAG: hypothetical protein CW680_01780 [Candidatus Bathyarchaeota archaeon]RLG98451.1 MAG: hypothetical protein DRO29_00920 [Candidatus Bathyarchaeota archaeon]